MPNYCSYSMKVRGAINNLQEFVERLYEYSHTPHMWRVFSAHVAFYNNSNDVTIINHNDEAGSQIYGFGGSYIQYGESYSYKHADKRDECIQLRKEFWSMVEKQEPPDILDIEISGQCAWSVLSCMTAKGYAEEAPDVSTTLQDSSKELQLVIEVYSTELGMGFAEHLHYQNGIPIAEECRDYDEIEYEEDYDYKSELDPNVLSLNPDISNFNAWKIAYDIPSSITIDDLEDDYYISGGYVENFFD